MQAPASDGLALCWRNGVFAEGCSMGHPPSDHQTQPL